MTSSEPGPTASSCSGRTWTTSTGSKCSPPPSSKENTSSSRRCFSRFLKLVANLVASLPTPVFHQLVEVAHRGAPRGDAQHAVEDELIQRRAAGLVRIGVQAD